jgi:hypothetical protein
MDQIDAKVFALITGGTTSAIGILKKLFPAWVDGKEEGLAQIFPIAFVIVAKLAHGFEKTDWVSALLFAVGGGLGAGIIHDKLTNPLMKGKGSEKESEEDSK